MSGEAGAPSNTTPSSRGKREQGWRQRLKDWMGKNSLFITITIWVGLAIFAFLLVASLLGHTPIWNLQLTNQESIVKTALTLVGGVGAVAYLVIKYQERQQAKRDEERARREETREKDRLINTKMQDAVNQLGSDKVSTRIAGVYALTDIADTHRGGYRQRVVDILCGICVPTGHHTRWMNSAIPSRTNSAVLSNPEARTRPWNPPSSTCSPFICGRNGGPGRMK